jgi:hypothetical protein
VNVNVYNYPTSQTDDTVSLAQVAQVLGLTPAAAAKQLGVNPTDYITIAQANKLVQPPGNAGLLAKIQALSSKKQAFSSPGFEAMGVTLPNGKSLSLSQLYQLQQINEQNGNSQSCLLGNSVINGRVSFMGQLDQDLVIGSGPSAYVQNSPQHLSTSQFATGVNNYDGNILIPRSYENYVSAVKFWAYIDEFSQMIIGMSALTGQQNTAEKLASQQKALDAEQAGMGTVVQSLKDTANGNPVANNIYQEYLGLASTNSLNSLPFPTGVNPTTLRQYFTGTDAEWAEIGNNLQSQFAAVTKITPTDWDALTFEQKLQALNSVGQLPGYQTFNQNLQAYAASNSNVIKYKNEVQNLQTTQSEYAQAAKILPGRAITNFAFGMIWLGPARFALDLAGNIFFTSNPGMSNTWIRIFAGNNNVAQAFQTGTDWMLSGPIIQAVSDFTKSGIPSKIFSVGNVMYIQEAGSSQGEQNSETTLSNSNGNWNIFMNWPGQAQSTVFEDISDNRAVTSLGIQENNTAIGGTIQQQSTLQGYYQTLYWAVPVIGWAITRGSTPNPLLGLIARAGLQDYYVTNIVQPSTFATSDTCSDAEVNAFVTKYAVATSVSVLSSVLITQSAPITSAINELDNPVTKNALQLIAGTLGINSGGNSLIGKWISPAFSYIDPVMMYKATVATDGFTYVSSCKDYSYKLLAFQNIPQDGQKANAALNAVQNSVSNPLGLPQVPSLSIFSALSGVGQQPNPAQLKQVLNIKTVVQNQVGSVQPDALYSFQINPSSPGGSGQSPSLSWFNQYENNGCFRSCLQQGAGNYVCADESGCYKQNPDGTRQYICSRDQSLNQMFVPGLGTFIPNKIITTTLNCNAAPVLTATATGSLVIDSSACAATSCTLQSLTIVSGKSLGNDLSYVLGKVQTIYTDQGVASVDPTISQFRFFRTTGVTTTGYLGGTNTNTAASGTTSSGVAGTTLGSTQSLSGTEQDFPSMDILGNGAVQITGSNPSTTPTASLGNVLTVKTQNGIISYDPNSHQLHVVLYVLSNIPASTLQSITVVPKTLASSQADYSSLEQKLATLQADMAANKQLSSDELALLQAQLSKPQLSSAGLSASDQALLQKAQAAENSGQPLTAAQAALMQRLLQQQPYPGVVVLNPPQAQAVNSALTAQNTPGAAAITSALNSQTPLTPAQANAASQAVAAQAASGAISPSAAAALQQALQADVPTSAQAQQIVSELANGQQLTPQQQAAVQASLAAAQQAALNSAANAPSGSSPAIGLVAGGDTVGGQSASAFNTAANQIGGLTQFSTPAQTVGFGTNAAGQSVLNIQSKTTGQTQSLPITGPITQNGNGVTVPTANGPVQISVNLNPSTGAPQVTLNNPNGGSTTGELDMIQGPNGLLYYDPNTGTWQSLNGLGISADPNFGKYGAQFTGNSAGTTGVAASDPFGFQQTLGGASSTNPLLSLPSWPDSLPALALMFTLLAAGFLGVRYWRPQRAGLKR